MKTLKTLIGIAGVAAFSLAATGQTEVSVVASSNGTIRADGPTTSPWFHNAQVAGEFASYAISSFTLMASDFGEGEITEVTSATISYTQANAGFTTSGPVELFITFDPAVGAGDYAALRHNGSADGVENRQFSDAPKTQSLGTATFTEVESGTVDTYTLDLSAVESKVRNAINDGTPFSIILSANGAEGAATYAGIENSTYPESIILTVNAIIGEDGIDPNNILPNPLFKDGEDGKEGWGTYLNVFTPEGGFKYGTGWDTGTAEVINGAAAMVAHPGWTDNGNGPIDQGDTIENNFYADFGGTPAFAGQEVTFSGVMKLDEALPEGASAMAFIKILDGSFGLTQLITADVSEVDGSFELTATVPTENMGAFQIGFLTLATAGSEGGIYFYDLSLVGDSGENLMTNPDFSVGDDGKEGWVTYLNVFAPDGGFKYGTSWDTGTVTVLDKPVVDIMVHPGWSDNGNGPADLGDTIENNFFVGYPGSVPFTGEAINFSGNFDVGVPLGEGVSAIAFIKVFDPTYTLLDSVTADVTEADGSFSLNAMIPAEGVQDVQLGFSVIGTAGAEGSLRVSSLSLEVVEPAVNGLMITGVLDGPLPGGLPKVIELYAFADIADLSIYGVGSANNGGGSDGEELTLEGSASAGDYIWIASEDVEFANVFGIAPDYVSDAAGINGDDAVELFLNGTVVDVFGEIDVDGSGTDWEYTDGWAYRNSGTMPDGTFVIGDWTFSGPDALDGLDAAGVAAAVPFGTYVSEVTEELPWEGEGLEEGDYVVSPWFGGFEIGADDWLQHSELGWIWVGYVETSDSMWMYSYYWDTWLWSSKAYFPIVYATGSEVWLYYFIVEGVGAYVFDYSTYTWTLVP
jgi:hypothetical protein